MRVESVLICEPSSVKYVHIFKQVATGVKGFAREQLCKGLAIQLESQTFSMVYPIDEWMDLDYHFTQPLRISNDSVEIFLKGEFRLSEQPSLKFSDNTSMVTRALPIKHDNRTIFIRVSERTVITAAQTLQKSGQLRTHLDASDKRLPKKYRRFLCTSFLAEFIPVLKSYGNMPVDLFVESHSTPSIEMVKGKLIHSSYTSFL